MIAVPRASAALTTTLVGADLLLLADAGLDGNLHDWGIHAAFATAVFWLVALGRLALRGMPFGNHLAWATGMQAYAVAPHALPGARHAGWTDAFLLHASVGRVGASAVPWLATALVTGAAYGWVWSRWRRARRLEVAAGMAPGYGLGGDALIRPQRPPSLGTLAFSATAAGGSHDVLLLHGLAASRRVWDPVGQLLAEGGVTSLRPDLLGFGASRSIGTRFGLDDHVTALARLLDCQSTRSAVVVGHSFGCAVAVALALEHPERVRALVLVCPPVFRSGAEARDRLGRDDWLARQVVNGSSGASVACSLMCLLRRPAAAAVARAAHAVPEDLARDGVQHSWPSYRGALDALLDDNPLPAWIDRPAVATTVILGSADPRAPAEDVLGWPHENVRVLELPGDHLLPLTQAPAITAAVRETLDRPVRGIERAAAPSPNAAATCGVRQPRRERRRS